MNLKFIRALPNKWNNITTAIRECNDMDAMPLEKLFHKLNVYELDDQKDALIRKYHQFIAKPGESITEMFDRFNKLVNDLRLFGRTWDNHEVNIKFLQALPCSWDSRAVAIRECNDMDAMTLEKLYEKLRTYEMEDRCQVLIQKYQQFIAKPGESITELYDRFNRLVNEVRLLGRTCDNCQVNLKFIMALPTAWDKWAVPIRYCNDMNVIPLEVIYGKLKTYILEDQQRKELRQNHKTRVWQKTGWILTTQICAPMAKVSSEASSIRQSTKEGLSRTLRLVDAQNTSVNEDSILPKEAYLFKEI